jgi:plasmid stabilization system protein ParE
MKYRTRVLARAQGDLDRFVAWLVKRSPAGAIAWYEAATQAIDDLRLNAQQHGFAFEGHGLREPVRDAFFKTKRGKRYRLLNRIDDLDVRILRVRGPGQPPVRRRDLR